MIFNKNMKECPYNKEVIFLFYDNKIHSGMKTTVECIKYMGSQHEVREVQDSFIPLGVGATYSAEAYFDSEPVGWTDESNLC